MANSIWTVKPQDTTVDCEWVAADGATHKFWIKLKKRLTVGEDRRIQTAGWKGVANFGGGKNAKGEDTSPEINIDWQKQSLARTEVYLNDWSLEDDDHVKLPLTRDTIEALDPDLFKVIEAAITTHVEAVAQEKKATTGAEKPSAT